MNQIIEQYNKDKKLYSKIEYEDIVDECFNKSIEYISGLNPQNIVFSFTNSEGLYFRFKSGKYEINLDVFYIKNDDIESVVSIFDENKEVASYYGELNDIILAIKNL